MVRFLRWIKLKGVSRGTITNLRPSLSCTSAARSNKSPLSDLVNTVSFYLQSVQTTGFTAKANSNNLLDLTTVKAKANTLYTLTSRNRFQLELYEGALLLGIIEVEPTKIPAGKFAELNIFNQAGAPIGTSVAGGLAFSAIGKGLQGSEIREFNDFIRFFMTQVGVIT